MKNQGSSWLERKCPYCDRNFLVPSAKAWAYQRDHVFLCSYTCKQRGLGLDRHGNRIKKKERKIK